MNTTAGTDVHPPLRPSSKWCTNCDGRHVALLPHPDNPSRWYQAYEYEPDGFTPSTRLHYCRWLH